MDSSSSRSCERSVKLFVGRRARRQIERIEVWWVANRAAAPTLFVDELEDTFRRLCELPTAGVAWPTPKRPSLRRILMPRTRNHVYFRVDEVRQVIRVLAIWGAPKGEGPRL
jgi:plasmid stabilization system protein ParE